MRKEAITSGNKIGGLKAAATNKKIYGEDFYSRIGAKGGRNGHTGGFASNRELAAIAGAKGGRISSRSKLKEPLSVRREKVSMQYENASAIKKEETESVGLWTRLKNFMS